MINGSRDTAYKWVKQFFNDYKPNGSSLINKGWNL